MSKNEKMSDFGYEIAPMKWFSNATSRDVYNEKKEPIEIFDIKETESDIEEKDLNIHSPEFLRQT